MIIHSLVQNTPEWFAHRATHWNASDAPAVFGISPYKTRAQLLREMHTGITAEVDAGTQRRFDDGHRFEALARPIAEQIIGEDLYPVVGSKGKLSASFDGLTLGGEIVFEHKSLNDELRAIMVPGVLGTELPPLFRVQMEQQLMVSGAERVLFMASKWNGDTLVEERHCWYLPDLALREHIIAAWEQFDRDLAGYVQAEVVEPIAAGRAPETLPALRIEVTGMVTASNLAEFKETALAAIRKVNRELLTDADFADAEQAVKWCGEVETRLAAAKEHALSQTVSIDALFKAIDDISSEARRVRLDLDKLVKHRKESIRGEIVAGAVGAFAKHVQELSAALGRGALPPIKADFAGVIKGKRTVASLRDSVDTELARVKIEANAIYQRMSVNQRTLSEHGDYAMLFSDWSALLLKAPDDLAAVISSRIAEHKAKEAQRLEAERERIRAEEQAKAQREAAEAQRVEAARVAAEETAQPRAEAAAAQQAQAAGPVVVPIQRPAVLAARPIANEPATLKLSDICQRLGFTVTAAFVSDTLGIQHSATDKASKLYRESDWPRICAAIQNHVGAMYEKFAA